MNPKPAHRFIRLAALVGPHARRFVVPLATLVCASPAWADTLITTTGSVAYASLTVAGDDLINQGQGTYAGAAGTATSIFDSNGSALADALILNNGTGDAGNEGSDNYNGGVNTYSLNLDPLTGGNAAGYNITSIVVTSGRGNSGCSRDTQFYDVEYHVLGGGWHTVSGDALATVARAGVQPLGDGGTKGQQVTVTDSSGTLASGVDQVRFTFKNPEGLDGSYHDACYREIDVAGSPTPGAPVLPTKLAITAVSDGVNPRAHSAFDVVVQAQDAGGTPRYVMVATAVSLGVKNGTGTLGELLAGTIAAGTNAVTLSPTYSKAESGVVLTATATSGASLVAADSAAFTVDPALPVTTTGSVAYASLTVSGSDLINQGQSTFGGAAATQLPGWQGGSAVDYALLLNDGPGDAGNEGTDIYMGDEQNTYALNLDPLTGGNAAGYDITSIVVTSGRGGYGCSRDTQFYDVEYHVVGGGWHTVSGDALATVARAGVDPYHDGTKGQQVTITDPSDTIAFGVDQVRFTFKNPTQVDGDYHGACYREIDVFGSATSGGTTYTVTFDGQGGTTPIPTSMNVTIGSPYGTLATTSRAGYAFGGWWTLASGAGTEVTAATTVALSGPRTLYALWKTPYQTSWAGSHAFLDLNSDGVAYGLAWILGAPNASANSLAVLPTTQVVGNEWILHFKRVDDLGPAHLTLELSDNLATGSWTTSIPVPAGNGSSGGVTFVVTGPDANGLDDVHAHIPLGGINKRFARLSATEN